MQRSISIWFFCGALMLVYGLVLLVQGVLDFSHHPRPSLPIFIRPFGGGVLLTVCGAAYSIRFRPTE